MKKVFNYILVFVLMFLCCGLIALPATLSFAEENEGSEQNEVINISDLNSLQEAFNECYDTKATFILQNDITFGDGDVLNTPATAFNGVFDGNGHTISNYKINVGKDTIYAGLFPWANGATIKNLKIDSFQVDINEQNTNEIYIGGLVGYGENVKFENCEFVNTTKITLNTYSNVNFGVFAGKIKADIDNQDINIKDCVNYFDVEANLNLNSSLNIGGIVGVLEQGKILNTLSFGNIDIKGECEKTQNVGGIAGFVSGTDSKIKNVCFGGQITNEQAENVNIGALVGATSTISQPTASNINFGYWTKDLASIGKGLSLTSDKIDRVSVINKDFLTNTENFDPASPVWDFAHTWIMKSSTFRLQRFETFKFGFATILDSTNVLDRGTEQDLKTTMECSGEIVGAYSQQGLNEVKYGQNVTIQLVLKDSYQGFYDLTNIILNSKNVDMELPEKNADGNYEFNVIADDSTAGVYSFAFSAHIFTCEVESNNKDQGEVKTVEATSSVDKLSLPFSHNSSTKKITAVGKGIFVFDHWELYYKNGDNWSENPEENFNGSEVISINFGTEPFNKEFKLVAYFTNENAIQIKFPSFNNSKIDSLKLGGKEYDGEPISVSPNATLNLEIITKKGFKLNYERFVNDMQVFYGDNSLVMISDPVEDEQTSKTTYKFNLYMKNVDSQKVEDKNMDITFAIENEKSSGGGLNMWIYIGVAVAAAAIIGVVIFLIIKKKRGPRKGGGRGTKTSQKKASYDDYYV